MRWVDLEVARKVFLVVDVRGRVSILEDVRVGVQLNKIKRLSGKFKVREALFRPKVTPGQFDLNVVELLGAIVPLC